MKGLNEIGTFTEAGLRNDVRALSASFGGGSDLGMIPRERVRPEATQRRSGWQNEVPIGPPPGVHLCDRMLDQQDRMDRAELRKRLGGG